MAHNKQRIKLEKKDRVRPGGSEDRLLVPSLKQHRYAGQDEGGLSWGEKEHTNMNMSTQKQLKNTNTILVKNKMTADCLQVKRNTDRF